MLFPYTIQQFFTRPFVFLSVALLLIPAVCAGDGSENKTNVIAGEKEVVLVSLPLKMEDAIINAADAGSGDNEDVAEENKRHQNNRPAGAGESAKTPDNSGEDIGYVGAGLLGAAIGAGLGAAWGGTGSYSGANNGVYQQGYYPDYYAPGIPYASVGGGYPGSYLMRPPSSAVVYRPPRPDSYYPGPGPAYGDYFNGDAPDAADVMAGFGASYPGYYSELLTSNTPAPDKLTPGSHPSIATVGGGPSVQKKPPTTGGTSSGYPIDWSAVAEAYYQDVNSRTIPSSSPSSYQTEDEMEDGPIFLSDSYPLLYDDSYY